MDKHPSTHPPLPPTSEDERLSWLRLLRSYRVGISTFYRLIHDHGSASAALAALPDIAAKAGVSGYRICPEGVAVSERQAASKAGARLIFIGTAEYPPLLLDLPDPPPMLWVIGQPDVLLRPMIGVVGARNASSIGLRMARKLTQDLADSGYLIVSGLARGIDAAAHQASLISGTVAVMAGGADVIYPVENAVLADDIIANGARVSEMPIGLNPQARHFPRRNRIISGLAQALVVVEAAAKSGSLLTARAALDQGREVLAVPGHPLDARASGGNMLIRDGAVLVRSAADIIEALPKPPAAQGELDLSDLPKQPRQISPPADRRSFSETRALHSEILARLGAAPMAEDQLIRDLSGGPNLVAPALTRLEMEGRIRRQAGGLLALC